MLPYYCQCFYIVHRDIDAFEINDDELAITVYFVIRIISMHTSDFERHYYYIQFIPSGTAMKFYAVRIYNTCSRLS